MSHVWCSSGKGKAGPTTSSACWQWWCVLELNPYDPPCIQNNIMHQLLFWAPYQPRNAQFLLHVCCCWCFSWIETSKKQYCNLNLSVAHGDAFLFLCPYFTRNYITPTFWGFWALCWSQLKAPTSRATSKQPSSFCVLALVLALNLFIILEDNVTSDQRKL